MACSKGSPCSSVRIAIIFAVTCSFRYRKSFSDTFIPWWVPSQLTSFPAAVWSHTLHHVIEGLGVHHVIVFVCNRDSPIAMEILIRLCFGHGKAAGKRSDECHDIFCDVFDAIHTNTNLGRKRGWFLPFFASFEYKTKQKILLCKVRAREKTLNQGKNVVLAL